VLNTTLKSISVLLWHFFLLVNETSTQKKTTDMSQITGKLYDVRLYKLGSIPHH